MNTIKNVGPSRFQYRYLARFIIEAVTPLSVGSGEADILTDAPVILDVNGLPYIPGTSIAGVIRHQLNDQQIDTNSEWGIDKSDKSRKDEVSGSNIIFTEARILNSKGEVVDGLNLKVESDSLLKYYTALPIRQHVRINEKGTTAEAGKYDGQIIYAGSRFCFEIEWMASEKDENKWNQVLSEFLAPSFRLGSGTRCGFGEMKVIGKPLTACLDLKNSDDLSLYLTKSSELQESGLWKGWKECELPLPKDSADWVKYCLELKPRDLFLFAAAGGDEEGSADTTSVKARVVKWNKGTGELVPNQILIPATSLKGAVSHRIAFHYNRLSSVTMEKLQVLKNDGQSGTLQELIKNHVGGKNKAVITLFGSEGEYKNHRQEGGQRGNVVFSDIILDNKGFSDKLVNHVSIDDFTGAAKDGHLFTEKPVYGKDSVFVMSVWVYRPALEKENIRKALENTFSDICEGQLPLGGGVCRGNGLFVGSWKKQD